MSSEYLTSLIMGFKVFLIISGRSLGPRAEKPISRLNCSARERSTFKLVITDLVMAEPPTSMLLVRIGMLLSIIVTSEETAPISMIITGAGSPASSERSRAKASVSKLKRLRSAALKILMYLSTIFLGAAVKRTLRLSPFFLFSSAAYFFFFFFNSLSKEIVFFSSPSALELFFWLLSSWAIFSFLSAGGSSCSSLFLSSNRAGTIFQSSVILSMGKGTNFLASH